MRGDGGWAFNSQGSLPGVRRMREVSDGVHWSRHCGFAFSR